MQKRKFKVFKFSYLKIKVRKKTSKKGTILMENVIFLILNLIFIMILIVFLARQGNGAIILEQNYAKQIALLIDSAKPGMYIQLDMEKGKNVAEKNGINFGDVVRITGNNVEVKVNQDGGYIYSFFNDVNVTSYPNTISGNENKYVISINSYN